MRNFYKNLKPHNASFAKFKKSSDKEEVAKSKTTPFNFSNANFSNQASSSTPQINLKGMRKGDIFFSIVDITIKGKKERYIQCKDLRQTNQKIVSAQAIIDEVMKDGPENY